MTTTYDTWGGSWANSWGLSWTRLVPVASSETRGGFDEHAYKKYRKTLETLESAVRERDEKKYIKELVSISKEISELDIETSEINRIAEPPKKTLSLKTINFDALEQDIELFRAYLDQIGYYRYKLLMEQDDEEAFLILMQ